MGLPSAARLGEGSKEAHEIISGLDVVQFIRLLRKGDGDVGERLRVLEREVPDAPVLPWQRTGSALLPKTCECKLHVFCRFLSIESGYAGNESKQITRCKHISY